MVRIAHILCPVDFSQISQHALDHAAAIARWYEARLTVLYVFANFPVMDVPPLVLGTYGRSGFQRLFLGSVTEKVIRKATRPTCGPCRVPLTCLPERQSSSVRFSVRWTFQ